MTSSTVNIQNQYINQNIMRVMSLVLNTDKQLHTGAILNSTCSVNVRHAGVVIYVTHQYMHYYNANFNFSLELFRFTI